MSEEEFEGLKIFLGLFYEWFERKPHHPPEIHPLVVMSGLEKKSRSQAKRGLEMAINDCVEVTGDWRPEVVALANQKFLLNGAPSLSKVRAKYSRTYLKILKRGCVKSLKEYYLIKGVLDGGGIEPGVNEEKELAAMLAEYESNLPPESEKSSG